MRTLQLRPEHLSTRDSDDGTAEITGLAVPWDDPITYAGVEERFARGAIDPAAAVGRPQTPGRGLPEGRDQRGEGAAARGQADRVTTAGSSTRLRRAVIVAVVVWVSFASPSSVTVSVTV